MELQEQIKKIQQNKALVQQLMASPDGQRLLAMLTKEDKVAVVRYLDEKGAFLIKKSAEKVADFLGISRFTVYNYLNEGNGTKESGEDG